MLIVYTYRTFKGVLPVLYIERLCFYKLKSFLFKFESENGYIQLVLYTNVLYKNTLKLRKNVLHKHVSKQNQNET